MLVNLDIIPHQSQISIMLSSMAQSGNRTNCQLLQHLVVSASRIASVPTQAIARLWRVAHFMLSDFLSLPIEEVSTGEVSLRMALCPTASPHVFVTAPPMPDRPWLGKPASGGLSRLFQSRESGDTSPAPTHMSMPTWLLYLVGLTTDHGHVRADFRICLS